MRGTYDFTLTQADDPTVHYELIAATSKNGVPQWDIGSVSREVADAGQRGSVRIDTQHGGSGQKVARDLKRYMIANGWLSDKPGLLIPRGAKTDVTVSTDAGEVAAATRRGAIFSVADQPYVIVTPAQIYEGLAPPTAKKTPPTGTDVFTGSHARFGNRVFFGAEDADTAEGGLAAVRRSASGPGSFLSSVGSFTTGGTTSDSGKAHGLGGTPKAARFWTAGQSSDGTVGAGGSNCVGITDFTTSRAHGWYVPDNASGSARVGRAIFSDGCIVLLTGGSVYKGTISNVGPTTFDITWDTAPPSGIIIHFEFFGGADLQAKVVPWTEPGSTGNFQIPGAGFQPKYALHIGGHTVLNTATSPQAWMGMGAMDANGNQWAVCFAHDGPTAIQRYHSSTLAWAQVLAGAPGHRASFVSMDADGCTLNFAAIGSTLLAATLFLGGIQAAVGTTTKKTSTGNQAAESVAFTSTAFDVASVGVTSLATVVASGLVAIGAASGTSVVEASCWSEENNQDPSDTYGLDDSALAMEIIDLTDGSEDNRATCGDVDLNTAGWLNWAAADANAVYISYSAFAAQTIAAGTYVSSTKAGNYFTTVGGKMYRLRYDATNELWYESWTDETGSDSPTFSTEYPVTGARRSTADLRALGPVALAGVSGVDQAAEFLTMDELGNFTPIIPEGMGVTNIVAAGAFFNGQVFLLSGVPRALWFRDPQNAAPLDILPVPPDDTLSTAVQNDLGGVSGLAETLWLAVNNQLLYGDLRDGWSVNQLEAFDSSYSVLAVRAWPTANQIKVDVLLRTASAITVRTYVIYNGITYPTPDSDTKTFKTSILEGDVWVSKKFSRLRGYVTVDTGSVTFTVTVDGATAGTGSVTTTGPFAIDLDQSVIGRGATITITCTSFMGAIELPLELDYFYLPLEKDIISIDLVGGRGTVTPGGTLDLNNARDLEEALLALATADDGTFFTLHFDDGRADWTVVPIDAKAQRATPESTPGDQMETVRLVLQRV